MYIKYKLLKFIYDFVQAKICTCTKVYYSFIQICTANIGHRNKKDYLQIYKSVSFDYSAVVVSGKVGYL